MELKMATRKRAAEKPQRRNFSAFATARVREKAIFRMTSRTSSSIDPFINGSNANRADSR
jgi:hypothetical protein